MTDALPHDAVPVYDIVGVGFGPSNLALAVALTERGGGDDPVTSVFLERQPSFGWHRGMLLEDATMQVSFLKDLATLRDPTSRFSFLSYLHSRGRLIDFINHKTLFPLRVEFHDYLEWAAAQVDELVRYGHEVVDVRPVTGVDPDIDLVDVLVRTPAGQTTYRARNLVVATGLRPQLPAGVTTGDRIWHNSDLLRNVDRLADGPAPSRFVVVGAGQSAAEVTAYLHERFADAEVCAVFARYGYSPADDSSFANRIFDPAAVDEFYVAPPEVKAQLVGYHANTNYSVVDADLIADLYRRSYQERVLGRERLRVLNMSRLTGATPHDTGVRVAVETLATGTRTTIEADVLVCATGYAPVEPGPLLGELDAYCHRDPVGLLRVNRDYRVATDPLLRAGVYLQGGTEHSHGISSSLLSNAAVRAAEILDSVVAHRSAELTPAASPV
ncbi:lysine N(6)-hydroxylase/L-ornithine N(5)-oxygenase family protein [Jidongwangia harbinensis]|uniref:lysine N(6)-hydroxylase/L-ornithine N(5)-oxygenase family protein n=1 Tax=Jidongwangia harbinensis TaxID=2878561 RepID=UPI001CD9FA94|nr:lysine N(6)-hydroxylase/L-ornithine N(5)-oxygenase family protein [Jidongwangia harbinensis]MCA2215602.1 lysine N(6)-hydroxylase/L-ornithine N(5)-oxygenase family protein [Jidongwangia harbinensis]